MLLRLLRAPIVALIVMAAVFAVVLHGAGQASAACIGHSDDSAVDVNRAHHGHDAPADDDGGEPDRSQCCSRTLCGVAILVAAVSVPAGPPEAPKPDADARHEGRGPPRIERPPIA
ncbi:MAG: hypothetical protein KIS96_08745 [Bauldia sp.]|nr:hypothetical protein [Bauldia sp.]